eukprot:XP_017445649.1 PREDICTED: pyroglutamyl-peptidase 1-like protein [Rattus norvegicus]
MIYVPCGMQDPCQLLRMARHTNFPKASCASFCYPSHRCCHVCFQPLALAHFHLSTDLSAANMELSKLGLGVDIELQTLQLPVDYREVKQRLTAIWEEFQPQLAVHVGMDTSTKAIFLEQCGKNRGYRDSDVRGFQPEDGVCLPGGPEVMLSVINMKEVCRRVAVEDVEVAFS